MLAGTPATRAGAVSVAVIRNAYELSDRDLMKTFSERKGLRPVSETIQIDSMTMELRNSLWNALDSVFWSKPFFVRSPHGRTPYIKQFSRILWSDYFKAAVDSCPADGTEILRSIRQYFFACEWNEVYDFLEFIVSRFDEPRLANLLNVSLERELAGYRFVAEHLIDVTNQEEIKMIEEAATDSKFAGVSAHIKCAMENYADRENPNYRNSIKESISAVESIARVVSGRKKATLSDALKAIDESGKLHPALKNGFLNLYGYTSDEQGIRHAMLNEPNLTAADARYFLVSCSSFVNYLKAQLR